MGTTYKKLNVSAIKRICKKTSILWNAEYKITFNSQNSIGSWTYPSRFAYYGDIIVISTANSGRTRTITCYKWDSPAEPRWSNTITWPANDAQYTYTNFNVDLIGRITVENAMTITASCTRTRNSYTITWKYLSAYPDTWTTETQTYDYGATPSSTSPNTVTSGLLRKVFTSWDNLGIVTGNRTITATYQHQGKFAVTLENCIQTDGDTINGWYPYGTNCSITATANSQWAFNSNGTSTASYTKNVPVSFKISPNYCNITVKGSYCTITVDGTARDPNWSGLVPNGANIVYTANTNYAFDSSGTTTKTVTVNGPGTYDNSPTYGYYALDLTHCHYDSGTTAGWYTLDTIPYTTVQADNDWSFSGVTINDTATLGGTVTVPIAREASPKYCNITVGGSYCTIKVGNTNRDPGWTGIVALETIITRTADPNYAFDSSGKATDTQYVNNPGTYSKSPTHGYYTLDLTHCRRVSGDEAGWYALYYSHKPSTTVKADDGWAFTRGGQETLTIESTVVIPTTGRASPAYFYLTFDPKHCKSSLNSGYYESSTKPSKVTWTPDPYYSFEAGTTQKSSETSISATGPKVYEASPQYVRADSISLGIGNINVNRNANTYYAADTVVTWTAIPDHYYDASGTTTTSTNNNTKITAGATISAPNPTHIKCTISGTHCNADRTTGSILPVGETITWTGDSEDNYKYSFSDKTENSATATAKVELTLTSYKKEAPYLWYNVTSVTGTNCEAYNSNSYKQPFISGGYYLEGTKIYWKTTELPYAMTESNDTTLAVDVQPGNNNRRAVVKRYTFTLTKNANVYSIKAWRTGSPYQGATIGSSDNPLISSVGNPSTSETKTATIYYGDTLQGIATASTGYHFDNSNFTTSKQYSSGSITANNSWSPTVSINTYTINLNLNVLPSNITVENGNKWLSLEKKSSAAQYPVGSTFNYNQTIYAIIKVQSTGGIDTVASGWSTIWSNGQYSTYVIGSITAAGTDSSLTITPKVILWKYSVTISSDSSYNSVYLSTNKNATSGSASGTTYEYGTTVYGFVKVESTKAIYYNVPSSWVEVGNDSNYIYYRVGSATVYSKRTIEYTHWTLKPKQVIVIAPSYVEGTYTSTSSTATSGNASGTEYARGTTVYGFVVINTNYFEPANNWVSVGNNSSGYACYRVGSVTVDNLLNATAASISSGNAIGKSVTIYFSGNYVNWAINNSIVGSRTAYNGDTLSVSGSSITCKDQSDSVRWTATASKLADTSLYTYSGTPTVSTPVSIVKGHCTVSASGVNRNAKAGTVTFSGTGVNWSTSSIKPQSGDMIVTKAGDNTVKINGVTSTGSMTTKWTSTASAESGYTLDSKSIVVTNGDGAKINNIAGGSMQIVGNVTVTATATELPRYNVTCLSDLTGLQSAYISTSSNATSGPQVLNVSSGTTIYGYAVLGSDVATNKVSSWTLISGTACKQGAIYRVGSKKITASTTYNINLFSSNTDYSTVLFTRAGAGVGSWTINNHVMQFAENQGRIYTSGNSIYASGSDYNGSSINMLLATFNCPSGYTVNLTLAYSDEEYDDPSIPWNSWLSFSGPYVVTAETTATSTTYSLAGGNDVTVSLPSGAQMLVRNSGTSNDPDLYFSASFDLVVVADGCHWGTYELYGRPALATIYIYNHNGYEHGWDGSRGGDPWAEAQFMMDNYTPIGVIRYNEANNSITVSAT